jgi:uncharacterized membrane protein
MAGIGFELRRLLKEESLGSLIKVYAYSALLSAGPWVISILAILAIGFIQILHFDASHATVRFQIIVTYAFALAATLIVSGFIQLPFTRFVSDLIYQQRHDEVLGNYFGVLTVLWLLGLPFVYLLSLWLLPESSPLQRLLLGATFLTLSAVWIANTLVSSLKYYRGLVYSYAVTYGLIILGAYLFGSDLDHMLFVFFAGNVLLLTIMTVLIIQAYPSRRWVLFNFFDRKRFYYTLGFAGLFYNLGTWSDKFIFWYHPLTGEAILGNIHASVVYDIPVFLAYLSIVPGMAVFFYRLETDFAEQYDLYYSNVRERGTLDAIRRYHAGIIRVARQAIREIIVVQAIVDLLLYLSTPWLFSLLKIPLLYQSLFSILLVGALLQMGLISVLALLFYLDRRRKAMWLALLFFILNTLLTLLSIRLGPPFYGYGYALSLLATFTVALLVLKRTLERLDYETFMLQ